MITHRPRLTKKSAKPSATRATPLADLLLPGGRLVGLFLYGNEPEPPPYHLTDERAGALFGKLFRLVQTGTATNDSVPVYQGMERWQEWERGGMKVSRRGAGSQVSHRCGKFSRA